MEESPGQPDAAPDPGAPPGPLGAPGGAASFEELFRSIAGPAYALASSLIRDASRAEDLLQEAALAAYRGFASFAPGTNFKAWFYRILTNCHFARYRRERRTPQTVELEETPALYLYMRTAEVGLHAEADPAERLMRRMTAEQVREAVASLPEEYRVAVSLFFLEESSYEEIAAVLECPLGTVRSRLHRGRKMLQKSLWTMAVEAGIVADLAAGGAGPIGPAAQGAA